MSVLHLREIHADSAMVRARSLELADRAVECLASQGDEWRGATGMVSIGQLKLFLVEGTGRILGAIDDEQSLSEAAVALSEQASEAGLSLVVTGQFERAIVGALAKMFGTRWSEERSAAWTELVARVFSLMASGESLRSAEQVSEVVVEAGTPVEAGQAPVQQQHAIA